VLLEELFKLGLHGNGEDAGGELLPEKPLRPLRASEKEQGPKESSIDTYYCVKRSCKSQSCVTKLCEPVFGRTRFISDCYSNVTRASESPALCISTSGYE